jgi:type II secretory pathway pseudopilin PulG
MPPHPLRSTTSAAFTTTELLVTVAVIGILGAVAVPVSLTFNRNEQAYAATQDLLGWLEAVSTQAGNVGPCTVSFTTGTNLTPGTTVASVTTGDPRCSPQAFQLPGTGTIGNYNVATTFTPNSSTTLVFSPRAGVVAGGVQATIRIVANNGAPVRCVRVNLASIVGGIRANSGNVADDCDVWD